MLLTSETLAALSIPEVAFVTSAARSLSDTLPELAPASTLIWLNAESLAADVAKDWAIEPYDERPWSIKLLAKKLLASDTTAVWFAAVEPAGKSIGL